MVVVEYTKMVVEDTHRRYRGSILGDTLAAVVVVAVSSLVVDWQ